MILLKYEKSKLFCKKDKINFNLHIKEEKLDFLIKEYEETLNFEFIECPICGSIELVGYGTYKRNIVINNINKEINIKRVQCKQCKHTHALIPSFIKPYQVYESSYIDFCVMLMLIRRKKKREIEYILNLSRQLLRKWELRFYKHQMYIVTTFKLKELREVINKTFEINFKTEYMYQNGMRYFS